VVRERIPVDFPPFGSRRQFLDLKLTILFLLYFLDDLLGFKNLIRIFSTLGIELSPSVGWVKGDGRIIDGSFIGFSVVFIELNPSQVHSRFKVL
jgi:hypothetical protein